MTSVGYAEKLEFKMQGFVGVSKDLSRIYLTPISDGRLILRTVNGEEIVSAKVISDLRGTDGNLLLDLGKNRSLVVTSGFSPDGKIQYILKTVDGDIELHPIVQLNVNGSSRIDIQSELKHINY